MKISQKLPQFINQKTLLIISANQEAKLYFAQNGSIELLKELKIDNPTYSDREGFMMRRGHGTTYGSGSVYEDNSKAIEKEYLEALNSEINEIDKKKEIDKIYIFVPDNFKNKLEESLHSYLQQKVHSIISGNFISQHPFDILKKLV
jgi:hypothetical protein